MEPSLLGRAAGAFAERLHRVPPDGFTRATPCADWDVRALVQHVVNELCWVPPLFDGATVAEVGDRFDGDLLGDDPSSAFDAAMAGALGVTDRPGWAAQIVHLSFGDVPGADYLDQVTADVTIHTWDLARAIGYGETLEPSLVEAVHSYLSPHAEEWRGAGAFADAVTPPADADLQTRLLGITGRAAV